VFHLLQLRTTSARRKVPDNDSTLPRLLTSVYTALLRCATASEACNLAARYGLSKRGAATSSPFCVSGLSSAYALEPFFFRAAHRFFIRSDNRFRPAGVRRSPFLLLRVARLGTARVLAPDCGEWPSSAAMARLSRSLSLFSSATILPVSKVLSSSKIFSSPPSLPETKGATSSHEWFDFAIAGLAKGSV
jgi:hypothetical protein